jgi:hypothetical protein
MESLISKYEPGRIPDNITPGPFFEMFVRLDKASTGYQGQSPWLIRIGLQLFPNFGNFGIYGTYGNSRNSR